MQTCQSQTKACCDENLFRFDWDTDEWHRLKSVEYSDSIGLYNSMFHLIKMPLAVALQRGRCETDRRKESDLIRTFDRDVDKISNCGLRLECDNTSVRCKPVNINRVSTTPVFSSSADVRERKSVCYDSIRTLDTIIASDPLKFDISKMTCFDEKLFQSTCGFPVTFSDVLESRNFVILSVEHRQLDDVMTYSKDCVIQPYYCRVSIDVIFSYISML